MQRTMFNVAKQIAGVAVKCSTFLIIYVVCAK